MKILIDGRFLGTGTGISHYTESLIENLAKIDKKNRYTIILDKKYFDKFQTPANNFKKIRTEASYYSLAEQLKLPFLIKKIRPDLVHFTSFNNPLLYFGPSIFTIHDLILSIFPPKVNFFKKWMYKLTVFATVRKAKKIIAVSKNTGKDLQRILKVKSNKIEIIYNGATLPSSRASLKKVNLEKELQIQKPYLLYIGRFAPHKNLIRLIEAFYLLKNKYNIKYQLILVGNKDKDYFLLKQKIAEFKLQNDIVFTGFLALKDNNLFENLYQNASLFVLPSLYEGFGLPILEAMARGIPVACSNTSSLPEITDNAAWFFDPYDYKDIAFKINTILTDQHLRKKLINKGLEQYKKFPWIKTAKQTLQIYENILK